MKMNIVVTSSLVVILFIILMTATGCQTPGQVVSTTNSDVCPTCQNQTVTTSIKGLKYTKHVCPQCETVYSNDASKTYGEIEDDMGAIHVCHYCQANVVTCKQCDKQ
jgi:hypothetical protein